MEDNDSIDPMFDNDLSPETLEQLDAIYRVAGKYIFATKKEFDREFVGIHPDELGKVIGGWQLLADAYLLFLKRYVDGEELKVSEAKPILYAFLGFMAMPPNPDADEVDEVLSFLDALPEGLGPQVMGCVRRVSENRKGGPKNENPDWPEEVVDRMWGDIQTGMLESLRSSGRRDSGRRKKRTKRARRK